MSDYASFSTERHDGARSRAMSYQWGRQYIDERQTHVDESEVLGARHEDLLRNNPIAAATIEAILGGTLGPNGLRFRSHYQIDDDDKVSDAELADRRAIENAWHESVDGTRFDAGAQLSHRDILEVLLVQHYTTGDGIGLRVWKPNRGGRPTTGFCTRLIHRSRIRNPDHRPDNDRLCGGFELDRDGDPIAVHVSNKRSLFHAGAETWTRVPIWGPDGLRNVLHLKRTYHPDQIGGWGQLRSILNLVKDHGEVLSSYVIAKRIQSMFPIVIETDDVAVLEAAARVRRLVAPGMEFKAGQVYIADSRITTRFENLQFNGADCAEFNKALLEIAAAAVGLPYEVVVNRLNESNMASARAALQSAWRKFNELVNRLIVHVCRPQLEWVLSEYVVRGRLSLVGEIDRWTSGTWIGPRMPTPDFFKDTAAAKNLRELGVSPNSALAAVGFDHDDEILQTAQDRQLQQRQLGAELPVPGAVAVPPPKPKDDDDEERREKEQGEEE